MMQVGVQCLVLIELSPQLIEDKTIEIFTKQFPFLQNHGQKQQQFI